jgi:hypothetical protein
LGRQQSRCARALQTAWTDRPCSLKSFQTLTILLNKIPTRCTLILKS